MPGKWVPESPDRAGNRLRRKVGAGSLPASLLGTLRVWVSESHTAFSLLHRNQVDLDSFSCSACRCSGQPQGPASCEIVCTVAVDPPRETFLSFSSLPPCEVALRALALQRILYFSLFSKVNRRCAFEDARHRQSVRKSHRRAAFIIPDKANSGET